MRTSDVIVSVTAALLTVAVGTFLIGPVTAEGPEQAQSRRLTTLQKPETQSPGPVTLPDGLEIAAKRIEAKTFVFDVTLKNGGKEAADCSLDLRVQTGGPRSAMSRVRVLPRVIWKQPLALRLAPGETKVIRCASEAPVYKTEVATLLAVVDGEIRMVAGLGAGTAVPDLAKELRAAGGNGQG